jgi:hypothetical protein
MNAKFLAAAVAFLVPLSVGAVTWTMDSSPFTFPGGVAVKGRSAAESAVWCTPEVRNGTAAIRYSLPADASDARLDIYSLSGQLVRTYALESGVNAVRWDTPHGRAAIGTYVVSLRWGAISKTVQFSVVR